MATLRLSLPVIGLCALIALSVFVAPICLFGIAMSDPAGAAAERHEEEAERLEKRGEWASAVAEYESAREYRPSIYQLLGIARCVEKLGDYDRALELYDQAILEGGGWYEPYLDKAECIESHEGADRAVEWLEGLQRQEGRPEKYQYLIGHVHMSAGRPSQAIPRFQQAVEVQMAKHGVLFDDNDQLGPADTVRGMSQNDLADLWPELTYIAECHLRIGDLDNAFKWATRGVSLHQHINRRKGYCSPDEIVAGDSDCRLVLARIYMAREQWDAAQREIDYAAVFVDLWSERRTAEARRELERRRGR